MSHLCIFANVTCGSTGIKEPKTSEQVQEVDPPLRDEVKKLPLREVRDCGATVVMLAKLTLTIRTGSSSSLAPVLATLLQAEAVGYRQVIT